MRRRSEVSRTLDEADATPTERHPRENPSPRSPRLLRLLPLSLLLLPLLLLSSFSFSLSLRSRRLWAGLYVTCADTEFLAYQREYFGTSVLSYRIIVRSLAAGRKERTGRELKEREDRYNLPLGGRAIEPDVNCRRRSSLPEICRNLERPPSSGGRAIHRDRLDS